MSTDPWLDRTREGALEPELPICDPHHHLWDFPESTYQTRELLEDVAGHNVCETVFVECTSGYRTSGPEELRPVGETDYVERLAKANEASGAGTNEASAGTRMAAGIVGFADLCLGAAVREVLEAHQAASPRFRGIRHASAFDPSDQVRTAHTRPPADLLARPDFREGFAALEALDLSFDAWLYHRQIPELTELARAFPRVRIVLDHVGGPLGIGPYAGKRADVQTEWRASLAELARCPNVCVKVGGMTMAISGFAWHKRDSPPGSVELAETLGPWYRYVIDQFGSARCMFESNFPVDRRSTSYTVLWNAFKRISAGDSADERADLFRDTARRFYRLDGHAEVPS